MNIRTRNVAAICGGLLMAGSIGAQYVNAAPPPAYPMMCKGGGNMFYAVRTMPGREPTAHITIWFAKGAHGASERPPQKGECTWLDRGMRNGEPHELITTIRGTSAVPVLNASGKVTRWEFGPSAGPATDELKRLLASIQNGGSFQFEAYQGRSARGNFLQARPLGSRR